MPYAITKNADDKFCVIKQGSKKQFGSHDTREQADAQMAALYSAEKSMQDAGFKDWDLEMAVYSHWVSGETAGYNPIGMTGEKGCANCNWFVTPQQCLLVSGDISPTGLSNLWMEKQEWTPDPMEVVIVGDSTKAMKDEDDDEEDKKKKKQPAYKSLYATIKSWFSPSGQQAQPPVQGDLSQAVRFVRVATKEGESQIRFFLWGTNNFKDRESEIFKEAAHKEFIEWADTNKLYPELWLWHSAGLKVGDIDWMDYSDGFLVASGLVAKDKEYIIDNIEAKGEAVGVSHGFLYSGKKNIVEQYRSWEFSVLPLEAAANTWTNFASIKEESDMGFTDKKKAWLKEVAGIDDEQIGVMEKETQALSEKLKGLGIDFKEIEEIPASDADVQNQLAPIVAGMTQLTTAVAQLAETVATNTKSFEERLAAAEKSDDEKIASAIENRLGKLPQGFQASSSKETIIKDGEGNDPNKAASKDLDWFGRDIIAPLTGAGAAK